MVRGDFFPIGDVAQNVVLGKNKVCQAGARQLMSAKSVNVASDDDATLFVTMHARA